MLLVQLVLLFTPVIFDVPPSRVIEETPTVRIPVTLAFPVTSRLIVLLGPLTKD
jgi:hypothetical protein